ncbi:alpha-E domain-containing protein [Ahrensia sp. R2A130]|uniref:alpha-E domain-containing protein n=1 Tax=Ahrensia sp. R2A130 TaxID=744979 RepID=UPI0001E094A4|nr:alpha-E domain-containing protein [Ahrensia sp. R2A130]EFL88360.1 conserved hypothetical protein [Ahrensia sp. R2A130]
MLGRTAGGIYWMCRSLERSENTARLVEAGSRIALSRMLDGESAWKSVVTTAGVRQSYDDRHREDDDGIVYNHAQVTNFLLRDKANPSSVLNVIDSARQNARMVRTAITTEAWEAINESWMELNDALARPIRETELPAALGIIRRQAALVRGALHGTMMRNDIYYFARLGTYLERADNTARIIDVKYYTLLPTVASVGSALDNVQWEMILRSVSAHRAFRWMNDTGSSASAIAEFLILDERLPRSLAFCASEMVANLELLTTEYGIDYPSCRRARELSERLQNRDIKSIFDVGLHKFIGSFLDDNIHLAQQIETDFSFSG